MCLTNLTLARYMSLVAEAGVKSIRFGTKELAFYPERFDKSFFMMIDAFHKLYPNVRLDIVGHYVHPYELVNAQCDEKGDYIYDIEANWEVREDLKEPFKELGKRGDFISHNN